MQKLIKTFAIFISLWGGHVTAQLSDTIKYSLQQKPKFFLTLASFNTFIDHDYASIIGIRMGLNFNQRIRFGIGYFSLTNNDVVSTIPSDESDLSYDTQGSLNLSFVSLSAEYFFFNEYPWRCGISPFQTGFGSAKYDFIDGSGAKKFKTSTRSETIILYQPETSVQYSVFKWLGLGVSTGYRFTLLRSKKITQHLNAPTFSFDVRFFLDEVYKMIFTEPEKN